MSIVDSVSNKINTAQSRVGDLPRPPRWMLKAFSILLFLLAWWTAVTVGFLGFDLLRTPFETLVTLFTFIQGAPMGQGGETLYVHAYQTIYFVALALALAVVTAIPLGLACGWSDWWQSYVYPTFELLRPIPPVAWVPMALIMFASESVGIVWVVFVGAFFPIFVNTMEGVAQIETDYIKSVQCLGGSRWDLYRHVVIPHTIPSMVTGVTIGVGIAWIAVVAAEMLSGGPGLGYITFQAYRLMDTGVVIVGIILLGTAGALSSSIIMRVGNRLTPWKEEITE